MLWMAPCVVAPPPSHRPAPTAWPRAATGPLQPPGPPPAPTPRELRAAEARGSSVPMHPRLLCALAQRRQVAWVKRHVTLASLHEPGACWSPALAARPLTPSSGAGGTSGVPWSDLAPSDELACAVPDTHTRPGASGVGSPPSRVVVVAMDFSETTF